MKKTRSIRSPESPSQETKTSMRDRTTSLRPSLLALALATSLGWVSTDVQALALGRITVLSALGEPLRAEVDVPEITSEEAASLRISLASAEAFRAAGFEYNPALTSASVSLQRRSNGRAFLRLSTNRPVADPFLDLIVEATWSGGRVVRDYTLLLDPPALRPPAATTPSTTLPALPPAAPSTPAPAPSIGTATASAAQVPAPAPAPVNATPAKPVASQPAKAPTTAKQPGVTQITVKAGDTAAAIAQRVAPAGISLDQMLVALLRANPDAFVKNNVNRLKAGAVLEVPREDAARALSTSEATRTVRAQSQDFNAFRSKLAQAAPAVGMPTDNARAVSGKVQSEVKEGASAAQATDKLKLTKAGAASAAQADALAKSRAADEAAKRKAELDRNQAELSKVAAGVAAAKTTATSATSPAKPAASSPGLPVGSTVAASMPAKASAPAATAASKPASAAIAASQPKPTPASAAAPTASVASQPAAAPASVGSAPASAAASAATSAVVASAPAVAAVPTATAASAAASKPKVVAPPPPPPPPEPTFVESLVENPLVPLGLAGALGLGGLAFWLKRRRDKKGHVDSSFLESRLQPDSFFGVSGGQQINTDSSVSPNASASSMVYSASQMEASGDVDPVAEADVYLAYGRDLQAEEILKEALRNSPKRIAVHAKLLDIYGKRRDARAYELVAREVFALTNGEGADWEKAAEVGHDLEPSNALYLQKGPSVAGGVDATATMPIQVAPAASAGAAMAAGAAAVASTATIPITAQAAAGGGADIDLDLDFSLDDAFSDDSAAVSAPAARPAAQASSEPTVAFVATPVEDPGLSFDLDISAPAPAAAAPAAEPAPEMILSLPDLAMDNSISFSPQPFTPPAPSPKSAPAPDPNALSFDLGGMSMDLDQASTSPSVMPEDLTGNPLETKLALAREFRDIGDKEGARELAREVIAEADSALKEKARRLLNELGG